jgi:50S ribosomal subunit-associated GTPase HflX
VKKLKKKETKPACVMVGNKIDLEREVSYEEAINFANEMKIDYIEVSAKENQNLEKVFSLLIKRYFKIDEKKGNEVKKKKGFFSIFKN